MKKTYILPRTRFAALDSELLIAASIDVNGDKTSSESNGGWVKRQQTGNSSYNVWNEDWSK